MSVDVREATAGDVEAVLEVAEAAWYAAYGGFLDPATIERGFRENYDVEILEAAARHDEIAFFVAEVDDRATGPDHDGDADNDGAGAGDGRSDAGGDSDDGSDTDAGGNSNGDGDADGAGDDQGAGDGLVGFASAEQTWADEVELHTLYVHPDRWGEGVGSALFSRVEAWTREQGVDRIAASVLADNAVGVGFFEAAGFVRGTEAKGAVGGEFHDEVEYEYHL